MFKYFLLITLIAWAAAIDDDSHAHVEKDEHKIDDKGNFAYSYDISNGVGADEQGDASEVRGQYHFTSKEGIPVVITYTADAEGYHPHGDLPTPPPTPIAILKALEYIKAHPKPEEQKKSYN